MVRKIGKQQDNAEQVNPSQVNPNGVNSVPLDNSQGQPEIEPFITESLSPNIPKFNYGDQQAEIEINLNSTKDEIARLIADNSKPETSNSSLSPEESPVSSADKNMEEKGFFDFPDVVDPTVGYIAEDKPIMTLHDEKIYKNRGFDPAFEVRSKGETEFEEVKTSKANVDAVAASGIGTTKTRPASAIDLSNIDESMIMNMPQIKAASFEIIDILNPKPKDPAIRFRWANYKNAVAGNLGRLKSLGFEVAHVDDVDMAKSHIDESMIDGTQIKYYDVILMKVGTIRLMSLYKANIIKSVSKLARIKKQGIAEAQRTFAADVESIPGGARAYNRAKQAIGGREPVEFYDPGNS